MENQKQTASLRNGWNATEMETLGKALTFCFKNSDQYGAELDLAARIDAFRFVLENEYSVEQILAAMQKHMKKSTEMFKPAHAENIMNPAKPRITEAQFVEAQKYQERNNWPLFSDAQDTIDEYRKQNAEALDKHKTAKIECDRVGEIITTAAKQITN